MVIHHVFGEDIHFIGGILLAEAKTQFLTSSLPDLVMRFVVRLLLMIPCGFLSGFLCYSSKFVLGSPCLAYKIPCFRGSWP